MVETTQPSPDLGEVKKGPINHTPEELAQIMLTQGRLRALWNDETTREALWAGARTVLHAGISISDFFPGIGEVISGGADILKSMHRLGQFTEYWLGKNLLPVPDLSPGVSWKVAVGSEILEPFTGGLAPTHLAEFYYVLRHDKPLLKAGREKWRKAKHVLQILQDKLKSEQSDAGRPDIVAAIETFVPDDKQD